MQNSTLKAWLDSSYLSGTNQSWIEQLYEDFLTNPDSVDTNWHSTFQQLPGTGVKPDQFHSQTREYFHHLAKDTSHYSSTISNPDTNVKQVKVLQLINTYHFHGHQHANLNPLGLWQQDKVANLDPSFHNLTKADFQETFNISSFASSKETMKLSKLLEALKQTYCSPIGAKYMHITSTKEKHWIQQHIKSGHATFNSKEKKHFLSKLTTTEGLEHYLSTKFPGTKHFSLEGSDTLIPMLKEMIHHTGNSSTHEVVLRMAHHGHLNMLVNMLGKKPQDLFNKFTSKHKEHLSTGDMKYHMGFSSDFQTNGSLVHLALAFNPSHLEIVSPVVISSVHAHLDRLDEPSSNKVLPITIHSDTTVTRQGVVQETLNMSKARGYEVGSTVHIIINNQVGFTTSNPLDAHSTPYCTDISKMVQAPIFHINTDDPEAIAFVTHLALNFHNTFKHDVFINLVCYHHHSHNKANKPSTTQPLMYQKIKKHPTPRKIYADKLEQEKVATLEDATKMVNLYHDALDAGNCIVAEWHPMNMHSFTWSPYLNHKWDKEYPNKVEMKHLQELAKHISTVPEAVEMQSHVAKIYNNHQAMAASEKLFNWGSAENLAYTTLVDKGIPVHLSGEDSSHSTFFHHHTVIHNQSNSSTYTPLQHIHNRQGTFHVWDSILSEEAVLAFEYSYATTEPHTLTIWEAQFSDFANSAQVVINQFISSGKQKWGQMCGLVMLLPHSYKGQGPEHSSTRLEHYLQLCAEQNMQVCIPSTPAQVYHMLHRQALHRMHHPLVMMSPKSLLHHPLAVSSLKELANSTFLPAISEINKLDPKGMKHVVMCSGKVYYNLLEQHHKNNQHNVAIVHIKQLYPFPHKAMQEVLQQFAHIKDFVWCQEEPLNQGTWYCSQHHFHEVIPFGASLHYAGHPASTSPAVGYMSIHQKQQQDLVNDTLNIK